LSGVERRRERCGAVEHVARHAPLAVRLALIDAHEAAADLEAFAVASRSRDRRERAALKGEIAVDDGLDGLPRLTELVAFECAAIHRIVGGLTDDRLLVRRQHDVTVGRQTTQCCDVFVVN